MTSHHEAADFSEPAPRILDCEIDEDGIARFRLGEEDDHQDLLLTLRYLGKSEQEIDKMFDNILRVGINKLGYLDNTSVEIGQWGQISDHANATTTLNFEPGVTYHEALYGFIQIMGDEDVARASMRSFLLELVDSGKMSGTTITAKAKNPMLTSTDDDVAQEMAAMTRKEFGD
jgi:hypothetical protein